MNEQLEETFVKKFIRKDKRERTLYELRSKNKRQHIIQHTNENVEERYIVYSDSYYAKVLAKAKELLNSSKPCYVLSLGGDDGKYLPFAEAFEGLWTGDDYIVISEDCNTVLFSVEYHWGKAEPITILHRKE